MIDLGLPLVLRSLPSTLWGSLPAPIERPTRAPLLLLVPLCRVDSFMKGRGKAGTNQRKQ